jgi:pimeloyl-ACP methyl ester carboxylesterase
MTTSADGLAAVVDRVRQTSGADKVDIVAHSQGGLVARQYVRFDGGADHVDNLIMLGTPNHGINDALAAALPLAPAVVLGSPAILQMVPGSPRGRRAADRRPRRGAHRLRYTYITGCLAPPVRCRLAVVIGGAREMDDRARQALEQVASGHVEFHTGAWGGPAGYRWRGAGAVPIPWDGVLARLEAQQLIAIEQRLGPLERRVSVTRVGITALGS